MKVLDRSLSPAVSFLIGGVLILVTLAAFGPVIGHDFLKWDDEWTVSENPAFKPVTWSGLSRYWRAPHMGLYTPVTYTVWGAVSGWAQFPKEAAQKIELNPRLFHAVNLFVHMLNVLLVFSILRFLLREYFGDADLENHASAAVRRGFAAGFPLTPTLSPSRGEGRVRGWQDGAAGIGALLFGLHPVQVEPVAWISGLKDLLCGFFSLLSIREFIAFRVPGGGRPRVTFHYLFAFFAFLMALLSKPTAVILPLLLWILDRILLRRSFWESTTAVIGWVAMAVPFVVGTRLAQQEVIDFFVPLWIRPFIAADAIAFYLYKLAWPIQLATDYGRSPEVVLQKGFLYLNWMVPFSLGILLWFKRHSWRWLFCSAVLFVTALLPTLGLVSFGTARFSTVSDRYLYLPLLAPALVLAWIVTKKQTKQVVAVSLFVLSLLGVRSWLETHHFRDTASLSRHTLQVNPRSYFAHHNLGIALREEGKLEEAIRHLNEGLRIRPQYFHLHISLGVALLQQGKFEEAISHFEEVLRSKPNHPDAHLNMGLAYQRQRRLDQALTHFLRAIEVIQQGIKMRAAGYTETESFNETLAKAHSGAGIALAQQGKLDSAVGYYLKALELDPDDEKVHFNLGLARARGGNLEGAVGHHSEALRINPDFTKAHFHLANILFSRRDWEGAALHYREVIRLDPADARAHNNLGVILSTQGNLEDAARHFSEALRIQPDYLLAQQNLELTLAKQGRAGETRIVSSSPS